MSELCKNYLDDATKFFKLMADHKKDTQEAKDLEKSCASYWNLMTDKEKMYVDEQTIRISQWLN
jgi:hypothetical protein